MRRHPNPPRVPRIELHGADGTAREVTAVEFASFVMCSFTPAATDPPVTRPPGPRVRVRRRRREHGARRRAAAGTRQRVVTDTADPPAFTFAMFDRLISLTLPGHVRMALFLRLPERWQQAAWDALAAEMRESRQ